MTKKEPYGAFLEPPPEAHCCLIFYNKLDDFNRLP